MFLAKITRRICIWDFIDDFIGCMNNATMASFSVSRVPDLTCDNLVTIAF